MTDPVTPAPRREVVCADATPWLRERSPRPGESVVTSLPDVSETGLPLAEWRRWFLDTVRLVVAAVPAEGAAVFFQSDIRRDGVWIDKGGLVLRAAEDAGAQVLWHKIVCRRQPGLLTLGRPGYTHVIAVSRALRCAGPLPIPDIITDPGRQPWVRAMGIRAAAHAVRFVRDQGAATTVVDPFCGVGTVLAVANALGLDAVGVERSPKRAEQARRLEVAAGEL